MIRREFMQTALLSGLAPRVSGRRAHSGVWQGKKTATTKKPRIMYFNDSRHPLAYMHEPPMGKEVWESCVDELVGTPVEALMLGLGDGRTVFHDTRVGEVWGSNIKNWTHATFRRVHQNVTSMIEKGMDPLRVVAERAQAKGIAFYPTLLLNQGQRGKGREDDVRSSDFRWQNRHLEIGAGGKLALDYPGATNLDFKRTEVRNERFSLIKEVVTKYPINGLELQLNYISPAPLFFHPDEMEEGRPIMTAWIRKVYEALKNSGDDRQLTLRIPASLDTCYSIGLDVREWVRQGIVDVLVGETYWTRVDSMADFQPLLELTKESNCRVFGALNMVMRNDRLLSATIEIVRAAACNYWQQGVDGLYLSQWFGGNGWPARSCFYEQLREVAHPDIMAPRDKFYHLTGHYEPRPSEPLAPLPKELLLNKPVQIEFTIADDLFYWDKSGRVREVLLRFRTTTTELHQIEFSLNGKSLGNPNRKINELYRMYAPVGRKGSGYWHIYKLEREYWPKKGKNLVDVKLTRPDSAVSKLSQVVSDVELELKYTLSRNFRIDADPDLGPFEDSGRNSF